MKMQRAIVTASMLAGLMLASIVFGRAQNSAAETQIKAVMSETWNRPDQSLLVGPIAVVGGHAVAGWTQGDMGGRALLQQKDHQWQIVLCSGDQLKSAETLAKTGLSAEAAKALAAELAHAESTTTPARLALFSKFEGLVMMDATGHHPPQHSPPGH